MKITSIALPDALVTRIDEAAAAADRSRSWVIRDLLARSLTGPDRLNALETLAKTELEEIQMPKTPIATSTVAGVLLDKRLERHQGNAGERFFGNNGNRASTRPATVSAARADQDLDSDRPEPAAVDPAA